MMLPKQCPYSEIYSVKSTDKWWGMIDPALVDPAKMYEKKQEEENKRNNTPDIPPPDPFEGGFKKQLIRAKHFHDWVGLTCHPNTYAYYGNDAEQHSADRVVWHTDRGFKWLTDEAILNAKAIDVSFSSGKTEIKADGFHAFTFEPAGKSGSGDGTVPTVSGRAVTQLESIKQAFALPGFDHQMSFNNAVVRHTVLYSIAKIAQKIQLNEDGTWKSAD